MCIGYYNEYLGCSDLSHSILAFAEMCSVAEDGWECEIWQHRQARLYREKCDECTKSGELKRKRDGDNEVDEIKDKEKDRDGSGGSGGSGGHEEKRVRMEGARK